MGWKSLLFRIPKVFYLQKAYEPPSKASRFRNQNTACLNHFLLSSKTAHFHKPKAFLSHKPFLNCHPKLLFSTLRVPFQRPLTYCLQRMQPFFCCSLNSLRCKAGASHRFKSLPAIPGEVTAFRKTGYLMIAGHFNNNHVSTGDLNRGSQGFAPRAFWLLFARCKKWQPVLPRRKLRGSAKLESAHRSDIFAPQQLKPFKEDPRFSKPRISTHKDNNFAQTNLNPFSALRRYPCRDGDCIKIAFWKNIAQKIS